MHCKTHKHSGLSKRCRLRRRQLRVMRVTWEQERLRGGVQAAVQHPPKDKGSLSGAWRLGHRAKSLAERKAYEMSRAKGWQLCTICPTLIQGPPQGTALPVGPCSTTGLVGKGDSFFLMWRETIPTRSEGPPRATPHLGKIEVIGDFPLRPSIV